MYKLYSQFRPSCNNYTRITFCFKVEFHPHFQQSKELTNIAKKNGIILQAYSPLGGTANPCLLRDPIVNHVAHSNGITPAQTLLRYALQRGYGRFYFFT